MRQNGLIGRRVADRFTIKGFLGEGGMATVYVAEQDIEPRKVALKVMNEDLNADRTFVKRFQREAKAAARVQHPNSVSIIDYGVADNLSYIAMELLEGDDLYVLLEREGAISQGRAVRILIEVCDALMVAHELGIVHRDLKPENIMVVADASHPNGERVKVLDFGIAKLLAPDQGAADPRIDPASAVTRAGTFIGTPAYMSPEQCALLPVDTRADIYTCGVLLFQLVTGRLPFEGQTPLHTATLHIHEPAPRPSTFAPSMDQRLEAVIMKALAKKPTDRHQTARHLASTLRKILPDLPDVQVSKVPKQPAGSLRAKTRGTAPVAPAAGRPSADDDGIESAKTMIAQGAGGAGGPLPAVVVHDGAPPSSQPDSSPARIRPAAGAPAPAPRLGAGVVLKAPPAAPPAAPARPAAGVPAPGRVAIPTPAFVMPKPAPQPLPPLEDEDDPSSDTDDIRTLVRAPQDEEPVPAQTRSKHNTEVMELPPAGAPSPAAGTVPSTSRTATPPPGSRIPKPTLRSAEEFKPAGSGDDAPAPPNPGPTTSPGLGVNVAPSEGQTELERISAVPPQPGGDRRSQAQIVVTPGAFAETAKVETLEPGAVSTAAPNVNPTAQTVPLLDPKLVAAAMAAGPKGTSLAVGAPASPTSSANPQIAVALSQPAPNVTTPLLSMPASLVAAASPAAPPPTPPIYPLAPQATPTTSPDMIPAPPAQPAAISGARGLLIGFLAGAVIMALIAGAYVIFSR